MTTATAPALTAEELLERLFPDPGDGILRLEAHGSGSIPMDAYFTRRPASGEWHEMGQFPAREPRPVSRFLVVNSWATIKVNLALRTAPSFTSPLRPSWIAWAQLGVSLVPKAKAEVGPRIDQVHATLVRGRLAAFAVPPRLVTDAGETLTALWLLSEPVADAERLRLVNHKLAIRVGGDPAQAAPLSAVAPWPSLVHPRIFPRHVVAAELWHEERVELEVLEHALAAV